MADLRITDLPVLPEVDVAATDVIPVADVSASETKKVTTKDLIEAGVALIDNGSIPAAKLSAISPASLGTSTLAKQFIAGPTATTGTFAARIIAAADLPIATAAVTGTISVGAGLAVTGGGALSVAASTSATIGGISVPTASGLTVSGAGVVSHISSVTGQSRNGFTVNDSGHITAIGAIPAADLPIATTAAVGGVLIGSGLAVTGGGQLNHAATLSPGTTSGITFNETGHITATTGLVAADIPVATTSTRGAVSVPAGALEVDGAGALTHEDSGVTPGTYAKVTVDARGHVTASSTLIAADIPAISATAITSGTIDAARFGNNSITGNKLANSSITKFGGAGSTAGVVVFPNADFTGQYFFDSINGDLYLWDGNAWQAITITAGEIVFAGTYNAATNLVASVTAAGSAIGLTVGSALPAAAAANSRYYLVVSIGGTGAAPAPAVVLAPPDMVLSNGTAWQEIDVSTTVTAQVASNISFTPTGTIASNNVQTALVELDTEKLALAGGTVTGELLIGAAGSLVLEGSTADGFETTIAVVDPTADRTITLPNVTGTVITTADSGTVTSTMILDGTIVNADINASAAIADTKLATIATALKVSNSATTAASANTASAIVARDGSGNFTAGTITAALTGAASSNVLKAGDTMTGALVVPLASAATPSLTFTSDLNTGIYSPGADQVAISTNGTGRLFVDASGLVGLGTSSPTAKLESYFSSTNPSLSSNTGAGLSVNGTSTVRLNFGNYPGSPFSSWVQSSDGAGTAYPIALNPLGGNVGIGTTSPSSALEINAAAATSPFIAKINTSEVARIDSSGRLLVGTSTTTSSADGFTPSIQVAGTGGLAAASIGRYSGDAFQPQLQLQKSRGAIGAQSIVSSGDTLGQVTFEGSDGAAFKSGASITALVDGTPGADDMPGRLVFSVTAGGAASPTEALRISNDRSITVSDGGNVVLGTTTGTKIGTGTTQKLGFYNATPVVQPTAVANATDAASVITQLNALLTRMRNLGLIAT